MADEREEIARIIDPKAWETRDYISAVPYGNLSAADRYTAESLAKADAILARAQGPGEAVDRKAAFVEGYKAAWSGRGDHTAPRREYIAKLAADAWDALAATPPREG